jgi:glutamine amidotransferase
MSTHLCSRLVEESAMIHEAFILDYGCGNHASLIAWLSRFGMRSWMINKPEEILNLSSSQLLIMPGVGHYSIAARFLDRFGVRQALNSIYGEVPILGICLGFQLMYEGSSESDKQAGLGWLSGSCERLPDESSPRIGWYKTHMIEYSEDGLTSSPGTQNHEYYYYNHSFYIPKNYVPAGADFLVDGNILAGLFLESRVVGLQFHPERSQMAGSRLLESTINFLSKP